MDKTALQRAAELEAQAKAIRRAEKQFWDDVDSRSVEVLEHFGVGQEDGTSLMTKLAWEYGISESELEEFILSDSVRAYYPKWVERQQSQSED